MAKGTYKKPTIEDFAKAVGGSWGNLSAVARSIGVSPSTVSDWVANDPEYAEAIDNAARKACDQVTSSIFLLATGIPEMQENPQTHKKEFVGWITRPDMNAAKYFHELIGRKINYTGGNDPYAMPKQEEAGVDISSWIRKEAKNNSRTVRMERRQKKKDAEKGKESEQ